MAARALQVRPLTAGEDAEVRRRAASRTLPTRVVERAKLILLLHEGERVPAVAARLGVGADVVRTWLNRFNAEGLYGLRDRPRSGRPATYTPEQVGEVIAASLTEPDTLGLPFGSWTLDRLQAYAVRAATAYWNAHRHPFIWGRRRRHRPRRRAGIGLLPKVA